MRLTATTTLDELGSLANHLSGIQTVVFHHIVREHDAEQRLALELRADNADEVLGNGLAYLKDKVLGHLRLDGQHGGDNLYAIDVLSLADDLLLQRLDSLSLELLQFVLHCVVLIDILLDDTQQVLTVAEERADATDGILVRVNQILAVLSGDGLDAANTGSHATLADNLEETDAAGTAGMDTTTELARRTEAYHAHLVAILLTEEGDGTEFLCLVKGHVAVLVDVDVLANHVVHHALHLSQLVVADFLEV